MSTLTLPKFRPAPFLQNAHLQTVLGILMPGHNFPYRAEQHHLRLDDGDTLVLHDDRPEQWKPSAPAVLLVHGLAGCHQSPYVERSAGRLQQAGCRTFRLDMRGCGSGVGLAKNIYHGGRSEDVLFALRRVQEMCPHSPLFLVGFSLGGNIVLKLLGEQPSDLPPVEKAAAFSPAIDLNAAVEQFRRPECWFYDQHFGRELANYMRELIRDEDSELPPLPVCLSQFDEIVTAEYGGFRDPQHYYKECSAGPLLPEIQTPTLIVAAEDDPLVPASSFQGLDLGDQVQLHLTRNGGHLGFIGRRGLDPDRRWADWRIVEWFTGQRFAGEPLTRHAPNNPSERVAQSCSASPRSGPSM